MVAVTSKLQPSTGPLSNLMSGYASHSHYSTVTLQFQTAAHSFEPSEGNISTWSGANTVLLRYVYAIYLALFRPRPHVPILIASTATFLWLASGLRLPSRFVLHGGSPNDLSSCSFMPPHLVCVVKIKNHLFVYMTLTSEWPVRVGPYGLRPH
jgi:hypothetical protein